MVQPVPGGAETPDGFALVSSVRALCAESPLWDRRSGAMCWTDVAAMEDRMVVLDSDFGICGTRGAAEFEPERERFNDGKVERVRADFWMSSIYLPRDRKAAGFWRLSRDGTFTKVVDGLTTANGIAWFPDGSVMYFADSWHRRIWAAEYNAERGEISRQREFFRLTPEMGPA